MARTQLQPPTYEAEGPRRASSVAPPVFNRAAWAGEPPIVSRLVPMEWPWRITVHHEGMEAHDLVNTEDVADRLRTITKIQKRPSSRGGLGAGDLAYHYVIDRAGRIWEGRSLAWQGAHAGNSAANAGNIGIVVLGNFELQHPSAAQLSALGQLLLELCERYGIDRHNIYGHNEIKAQYGLGATCCPGRHLSTWLESFRTKDTRIRRAAR